MALPHKYVFTALVSDKNDPMQLMAYSIYKADKNEIAETLVVANKTPGEIEAGLQNFHDSVINSPSLLLNYHARAQNFGAALLSGLEEGVKVKARQDFVDCVQQQVASEKGFAHHVGTFCLDAVKGVASTLFVIVIFGGVYSLSISKEQRAAYYHALGQSLTDVATGEIPVIDNFRAHLEEQPAMSGTPKLPAKPPVVPPEN